MIVYPIFLLVCGFISLGVCISSINLASYWHKNSKEREFAPSGDRNTYHRNKNLVLAALAFAFFVIVSLIAFSVV